MTWTQGDPGQAIERRAAFGRGGMVRPPNAPPAAVPAPGVQAGSTPGLVVARKVIVFGPSGGVFGYSPAPGPNQLVFSSAAMAGTDPYLNNYLAGDVSYMLGPTWSAVQINGNGLTYYVNSASGQNGTWTSQGELEFRTASSPELVLPSGFTGVVPATSSDSTTFTATTTANTGLSKAWDVPLGDAAANTIYRLTVWGDGTQGSTADPASFSVHFGSVNILAFNVAAAVWSASVHANWFLQVNLQCTAAGASGNMNASGIFLMVNSATEAGLYASPLIDNTNAINTTIDNKVEMFWQWSAVTGGPTVSSYGSIFERFSG